MRHGRRGYGKQQRSSRYGDDRYMHRRPPLKVLVEMIGVEEDSSSAVRASANASFSEARSKLSNVRSWHKADIDADSEHVRYWRESGPP